MKSDNKSYITRKTHHKDMMSIYGLLVGIVSYIGELESRIIELEDINNTEEH